MVVSSVSYRMILRAARYIALEPKFISKPDTENIPIIGCHLLKDEAGENVDQFHMNLSPF